MRMHLTKPYILFLWFIFLISFDSLADNYPNLDAINIGEAFPHPNANAFPESDRPTTQFRVPNYGDTSELFPEYEVVILNSTKEVVVVSARISVTTSQACKEKLENFRKHLDENFKNYSQASEDEIDIKGLTAYTHNGENSYYTIDCIRSHGPFWNLEYQIRGKNEDKELNASWEQFFKNR